MSIIVRSVTERELITLIGDGVLGCQAWLLLVEKGFEILVLVPRHGDEENQRHRTFVVAN